MPLSRASSVSIAKGSCCSLSYDDVTHYGRIVVALKETIRLMARIDEVIPAWPIK